ncbi:MAG: hybrid sensor histidine kinase/response regulator [Methanomicrobiales archaeon]|nr:hybrid sensor histidine kinase/response regulator [Methanomicrobiales archaeon]
MARILIADDNPQNLYMVESLLKNNGFEVVMAVNGAEALDEAVKNPPDLIISDILMPVMDGFELCRRWKADDRLCGIPFIFYTATYTDPRDELFAKKLGADRFIIKPKKPDILMREIREVLNEAQDGSGHAHDTGRNEKEILQKYNEVLFRKLESKVRQLEDEIVLHRKAEEQAFLANRKLALMTEITYQDIQNKMTALRGYAELLHSPRTESERQTLVARQVEIFDTIHNLITKSKDYQRLGTDQVRWVPLEETVRMQMSIQSREPHLILSCDLDGYEILTDPLIDRVFYNLIHNTIRHGIRATRIAFSCRKTPAGLCIVCEDDGVGIPFEEKPFIFTRFPRGDGKFGLFFVAEFLKIAGMTIAETGEPGRGARFEITIPPGKFKKNP